MDRSHNKGLSNSNILVPHLTKELVGQSLDYFGSQTMYNKSAWLIEECLNIQSKTLFKIH